MKKFIIHFILWAIIGIAVNFFLEYANIDSSRPFIIAEIILWASLIYAVFYEFSAKMKAKIKKDFDELQLQANYKATNFAIWFLIFLGFVLLVGNEFWILDKYNISREISICILVFGTYFSFIIAYWYYLKNPNKD